MMTTEKLVSKWDACFDKESGWYPPLERGLQGLTAVQACWRADGKEMNTIKELVNHIIFYKVQLLSSLASTTDAPSIDTSFNTDTGVITEEEWQETIANLKHIHTRIREKLSMMSDQELLSELDGVTIYQWVSDLVLHDIYHTGQIIFIRKMQGSWTV
ncbi:DinB family protein [Paenibacillus mendelii]|uniref:DinB family protein n=1 Tax=Paenibacillus mendelii TaxID=206163 RepID=A0ABV6J707_9BACL|nr:DinB family protein [Paenibacillus mendelii]MCQ6560958.1 DinB family protein [Paenibacillus mendelii]